MATAASPPRTALRLTLPDDVLGTYERLAHQQGVALEELLVRRLHACQGHDALHPVYLTVEQRQRLGRVLRRNLRDGADLVSIVERLAGVRVDGAEVQLHPDLLNRLRSRCLGQQDFREWLGRIIREQLEQYCGMR